MDVNAWYFAISELDEAIEVSQDAASSSIKLLLSLALRAAMLGKDDVVVDDLGNDWHRVVVVCILDGHIIASSLPLGIEWLVEGVAGRDNSFSGENLIVSHILNLSLSLVGL